MKALAEFTIALADLVRLEVRHLRRALVGVGIILGFALIAAVLALMGVATVLMGLYMAFETQLRPPTAAILTGLITIMLAGGLLWISKRLAR